MMSSESQMPNREQANQDTIEHSTKIQAKCRNDLQFLSLVSLAAPFLLIFLFVQLKELLPEVEIITILYLFSIYRQ